MPKRGRPQARRFHRINSLQMTLSLPCAKGYKSKEKVTLRVEKVSDGKAAGDPTDGPGARGARRGV
jgi:hypothetical protein